MALTNIEYGSIASSDTLNGNFSYLDERITDSNNQINTSISSILSNIATINSRLTEISEALTSSVSSLEGTISDYKTKTKLLVKNYGMVPGWNNCTAINLTSGTSYTATSNGYVLVLPVSSSSGSITVNGVTVQTKAVSNGYDYASVLLPIPVRVGDILTTTINCTAAYLLPAAEITIENF